MAAPECGRLEEASVEALRRDSRVRVLFEGPDVVVGEFHCGPDDRRWSEENCTEEGHFVVFPGTSVVISHTGAEPVVTSPNHLMLYNRNQTYRRRLLDPRGDHCVFLLVAPAVLAETARTADPDDFRFSSSHGPASPAAYLLHRLLVRWLDGGGHVDRLQAEEASYRLVADAVRMDMHFRGGDAPAREATRLRHRTLVEETKTLLTRRFAENLSLGEIAAEVLSSPFHLARAFRARTGFGIHEYRNQLRLRAALDRIFEPDADLRGTALALGYASHSHFTDSFRRAFHVSPSQVRAAGRRGLLESRTIAEAARIASS